MAPLSDWFNPAEKLWICVESLDATLQVLQSNRAAPIDQAAQGALWTKAEHSVSIKPIASAYRTNAYMQQDAAAFGQVVKAASQRWFNALSLGSTFGDQPEVWCNQA